MSKKMLIISPVRNEAEFIENTLRSVVSQVVLPAKWIVIDDGSSDDTFNIVKRYADKYDWIELVKKTDRGVRAVGPGVVETFNFGLALVQIDEYDFICKMDGDISFGAQYFEVLLSKFEEDEKLGAASGKPYITVNGKVLPERTNAEMVAGQINFYRRQCFKDIGGFVQQVHWDGIAFHRARMEGWRTSSFTDEALKFMHLRLMGSSHKSIVTGRLRWGKGQYFIGTHPLYLLGIGLYRTLEKPYLIGGALIVSGYIKSFFKKEPRYNYPGFRKSLHAWQMERLKLGKRLEKI